MAKTETAPSVPTTKPMKPTTRFDVSATHDMPKVGDMVDCHVRGKVCRVEAGVDRYGDGKKHGSIEIEHDKDAVKITKGKRSLKQIEDANEAV